MKLGQGMVLVPGREFVSFFSSVPIREMTDQQLTIFVRIGKQMFLSN